jgi:eukaryotic-like serine/threonine-protein kinase
MAFPAGTRFGSFEILSLLGAGGMGEVYRARDTRLNRDVAIKVLPDALTADPERMARFTREAQTLAALNHSNIGAIHGLEDVQGRQALVLELVEGPTLADRIAQGALPLDEVLPIARQIVEGLEAAHEQGIIHRDLKPANIKLRPDGTVKVLDFGLAKALSRTDGSASSRPDVTASPTLLSPATMTSAGVILGTAAYMSPEQARGRTVDRRADNWAFGCVVYEMLTGRRTFEGEEVTDTLAGILRGEPDWNALPPSTPQSVRRLLRRCLQKDPRERLQAIGDARLDIVDALSANPEGETATTGAVRQRSVLPIAGAAIAATAVIVGVAAWMLKPGASDNTPITRSLIETNAFDHRPPAKPGEVRNGIRPDRTAVALSPDGRTLVIRGIATEVNPGGGTQSVLLVRSLDSLTATAIPTTTGGDSPFLSPDGAWIGYWDAGELRRVPVSGSTTYTTIARVPGEGTPRITGASWGDGDVIVFSTTGDLWRVAASGGSPEAIVKKGASEHALKLPHVLPGGKAVLFTRQSTAFRWDDAQVIVRSLVTGDQNVLLTDAADARYLQTGHIVFMRRGKLMAVPFDLERLAVTGGAVAIVDDVMQAANMGNSTIDTGAGQFAISTNGTLVYATGGVAPDGDRELVWVARDGSVEPLAAPKRDYLAPRLSPDGNKVVAFTGASVNEGGSRVWIYDIARQTQTPLTTSPERGSWGVWSPDASRVAFMLTLAGRGIMTLKSADGTGSAEQPIPTSSGGQAPNSWSRDDKIAFVTNDGGPTGADIWVFDVRTRRASALIQTAATETFPAFSTDGKWVAYTSDVSGSDAVYVQPYPGSGPRIAVSTGVGSAPAWKADSSEIYYLAPVAGGQSTNNLQMMAVGVRLTSSGLSVGAPQKLFEGRYATSVPGRGYDVRSDGRRFVLVRPVEPPPPPPSQMILVQNFGEELKRRVPAGTK